MTELAVAVPDAPRARYALGVLLDLLGLTARVAQPGEPVDLAHGMTPSARCSMPATAQEEWDDPGPEVTWDSELAILHRRGDAVRVRIGEGELGFDVLYATYACLTAPWERVDPADEVGCPLAAEGFLARNGLLLEPLVHRYATLLGSCLGKELQRESRIVITHDVDNNFGHVFRRRESAELLRRDLRKPLAATRRAVGLVRRLRPLASDPNDRFTEWADWHRGWGSRPAYFVASYGLFERGSDRRDVPYDLRHPSVAETLRRASDDDAEIGVHLSLRARGSADQIRRERDALAEVLGHEVRSARHHWWALETPSERTWRRHGEARLELDCSLGFNDRPGFRRGICVPFHPFDTARLEQLPIHVLPTLAMDAAVFDGRDHEQALAELRALRRAVTDVGGALVLDWHVHAANPSTLPGAARGLLEFVDESLAELAPRTPLELLDESR